MDRKLLDYLPPVLREVDDFQVINEANEPEISAAWDDLSMVLANQFLDDADEHGVAVWERELRIHPKDTDTMELRKARIKAMWNLELPYTLTWLRQWLTGLCGPMGYEESVTDYTINIKLDYTVLPEAGSMVNEILGMLLKVRPANMLVLMAAALQSHGALGHGVYTDIVTGLEVWPYITHELESTAHTKVTGSLEYHRTVEVWPHIVHHVESMAHAEIKSHLEYRRTVEIYPK